MLWWHVYCPIFPHCSLRAPLTQPPNFFALLGFMPNFAVWQVPSALATMTFGSGIAFNSMTLCA